MEVLLLDNHDSFTYNIAHIVRNIPRVNLQIIKSDSIVVSEIERFDKILFSPGPDIPREGNVMESIISKYGSSKPIFGICLGLQAIFIYFGGELQRLNEVVHGRTKLINITRPESKIFKDIPGQFEAGLYHSWIADTTTIPENIEVIAYSENKRIMAIRHKYMDIVAVQFHPESIMTPFGPKIIENWLRT